MAFMYADQAWGKAPERLCARIALALTFLEGAGLVGVFAYFAWFAPGR